MGNVYKLNHHRQIEHHRQTRIKPIHQAFAIWHLVAILSYFSVSVCDGRLSQLVDLSHVFDEVTLYWVTEPSLVLNVTYNGTLPDKEDVWYQKDQISAATHGGTHIDAPCHFAKGRWCVADIPLERLVVKANVVDITDYVHDHPDVHLTKDMLLEWEELHGPIQNGSLLLIHTGWSQFWPNRRKYTGTDKKDVSSLRFPSITAEAAEFIVNNRSVVGVGIDTMSVDIPSERPSTHVALMENNIYALENLKNLDMLPRKRATVYVMPMNLRGASGAPCRVVAQFETVAADAKYFGAQMFLVIAALFVTCGIKV